MLGDKPLHLENQKRVLQSQIDPRFKMSVLQDKVQGLEEEMKELKEHLQRQEREISELQSATGQLASAFHGYLDIRNRFIETFRRGILGLPPSRSVIIPGDFEAQNGDAAVDYLLYTKGLRKDTGVMQILYGLTPEQVCTLSMFGLDFIDSHPLTLCIDESHDDKAIRLLNAHATLRANSEKGISEDLEIAFGGFIVTLQEHLEETPIKNCETPLGHAYRRFWTCYARQVNEEVF